MGFVEGVTRETLHLVKDRHCRPAVNPAAHTSFDQDIAVVVGQSFDEYLSLLLHDVRFFLAHGTADDIRSAVAVSGKGTEDLHDLFLVDDAAIGHIEDLLQQGMLIAHLLRMVTAVDIGVDTRHRSRTKQGGDGDQVLDTVGLQAHEDVAHALALELEHALGGAAREHGEHLGVVLFDLLR